MADQKFRRTIQDNLPFLADHTRLTLRVINGCTSRKIITRDDMEELGNKKHFGDYAMATFFYENILRKKDVDKFKLFYELIEEEDTRQSDEVLRILKLGLEDCKPHSRSKPDLTSSMVDHLQQIVGFDDCAKDPGKLNCLELQQDKCYGVSNSDAVAVSLPAECEIPQNILLGIDLGTTYSCVGIWRNGKVEIVSNALGNHITASCVSFSGNRILVGDEARCELASKPENTVLEVKRLIGRQFDDPNIQEDLKRWPFKLINSKGFPAVEINFNGIKHFSPQEISALILEKMKGIAEEAVGYKVTDAVITVPANFKNAQRESTKNAAIMAGLRVLQIVNEPTAAALAYGLHKKINWDDSETIMGRNVLVYDLGGGTFDVTILSVDINVNINSVEDDDGPASYFDVLGTDGDTHLGGEDFTSRLVNHFVKEFREDHNIDIKNNNAAIIRLRKASEHLKRELSYKPEATITISNILNDLDFSRKISRAFFEDICADLFDSTIKFVEKVISSSGMKKSSIQEVVLIGGSTRIPKIRQLLQEYFDGEETEINNSINPDEAVAIGATILAATLTPSKFPLLDVCLTDVIPMSLGVVTEGYKMTPVFKRYTPIPGTQSKIFSTLVNNQTTVAVWIYEGESEIASDNTLLGKFMLHGISLAPRGIPKIDVKFEIDGNGILHVSATEALSGANKSISIRRGGLKEVGSMTMAGSLTSSNEHSPRENSSRASFENCVCNLKYFLLGNSTVSLPNKNFVLKKCEEALNWLDENPNDTCETKLKEFKRNCNLPKSLSLPFEF